MPSVTVLNTGTLSLVFETPAVADNGTFQVNGLSLRAASGLFTALPSTPATIQVSPTLWNFGATPIVFTFGPVELVLNFNGRPAASASWKSLRVEISGIQMRFAFSGLRIASDLLPGVPLEGDANLVFENAVLQSSTIALRQPVALSASLAAATLERIALNWTASGAPAILLPGVQVAPPAGAVFSLILDSSEESPTVTLQWNAAANQVVTAGSGFAWARDSNREIHPGSDAAFTTSLFDFTARAQRAASLTLVRFELGKLGLPKFFQQASADDFQTSFQVNPNGFRFPFLNNATQFIQIVSFDSATGDITLKFEAGGLKIEGLTAKVSFDQETFSLNVDHEAGIQLRGPRTINLQPHLGLNWKLETDEQGTGDVHWFTLVTKNSHYQIQLAPTAKFVLEYTQATREGEPIRFVARKFALGDAGISLTAEVQDDPARLNGINTRFSFHGTRLEIVENRIQDFTLTGSGPLPPDLVGDATADIALQFQQKDGALALVSGAAELKGAGLLEAKTTHFTFKVDALGMKFVDDHGYHLYFTVTGSATYVPEPFTQDNDPLHFLSSATIELVECPLTGDARVLAKHINFLIEFNEPVEFKFLGAFTFELRAIGFLCSVEAFDGDAALQLSGQIMFSPEGKDTKSAKVDFHGLLIGAPEPGDLLPRIHLDTLGVEIEYGDAFHLSGEVEFRNTETEKGFLGEGVIEIKGMPTIAASFAFLRVRLDKDSNWVSAWFIFIEVRKVSFQIPVVEIYLREVGLGFGYRFTLTSIKTADTEKDIGKLIGALRELSRTAGDLSKRDRWALDLEERGEDPRWTIVFRAMFSQTSASTLLKYNDAAEKNLPCVFLFDAVAAFRSDLTFFMAARGWINTNYNDFVEDRDSETPTLAEKPIVSGFIILSPRQKRLLAHVASNPEGSLGTRPAVPDFVRDALAKVEFSATLLIEPGLFHFELGWPNMLRWSKSFGPLNVEFRGGFIYRVTAQELIIGISFQARASLEIKAELNLVVVGAKLEASMHASLGARLLAVTSLQRADDVAVYAAIGIDVRIAVKITLWIGLDLGFVRLTKDFTFSFSLGFTAGLEVGLRNSSVGIQGSGTLSVEIMGHSLHFHASFEKNAQTVLDARERTSPFLKLGLEATEVEDVPGIPGGSQQATPVAPPSVPVASTRGATRTLPNEGVAAVPDTLIRVDPPAAVPPQTPEFQQPNYVLFLIHEPAADGKVYFLLMPKGENETGFLPAPPALPASAGNDFQLALPAGARPQQFERFDALTGQFTSVPDGAIEWKANWNAPVLDLQASDQKVTLAEYLKHAYIMNRPLVEAGTNFAVRDPVPLGGSAALVDDRVQNPTDSSFEAAVRGAAEQFRGSPLFRRDPDQKYDRSLGDAFNPATSLYVKANEAGDKVYDPDGEHAAQFRSTVVHDLVEDFRADVASNGTGFDRTRSIPFHMGLVFRMANENIPAWVTDVVPENQKPKIRQRNVTSFGADKDVSIFNVSASRFDKFPPQFERVRQYTSSNTIALAWDLTWVEPPKGCTGVQAEPEHHLRNYEVRRRALGGGEREVFYTVKNASSLNLEDNALQALKPRFKVVDHFNEESLEQQAALPESGRSYLYTITPCDVAGNLGRPLTLVATRFPDEPPAVPANGELTVAYPPQRVEDVAITESLIPTILQPASAKVTWRDPVRRDGPFVPVRTHRLIFRRTATLPVGSYAFDAVSSQPRKTSLPTSNARTLPTDVRIDLEFISSAAGGKRSAEISLSNLRDAGVLPAGSPPRWRPEAWSVFFQTESANGVPSALAPVQVLIRFAGPQSEKTEKTEKTEERRPGELEFLPTPMRLPLLPPEDMTAITGIALFPMPKSGDGKFLGRLGNIQFREHPQNTRGIRFRWNQAPSALPGYEPRLHAGYSILELNIDANTEETFNNKQLLADALWTVQEVRMLPPGDLLLAPCNTLATSQWEAWYPSSIERRNRVAPLPIGSEAVLGSWFSSRDSYLEWPPRAEGQNTFLHPDLEKIIQELRTDKKPEEGGVGFIVDVQVAPPVQEMDLAGLLQSTAPGPDAYGWGILQRFGLSVALSLRAKNTGELVTGAALLAALQTKVAASGASQKHLYVELLFQPGRSVSFDKNTPPAPESLLGIVQLSLRPAIVQLFRYFALTVTGKAGADVVLKITPKSETTLLNPLDPASGEIQLTAQTNPLSRTVRIPMTGKLSLLLRTKGMTGDLPVVTTDDTAFQILGPVQFPPTDDRAAAFTTPVELLAKQLSLAGSLTQAEWANFKRYAESLNSNQRTAEQRIAVPTDEAGINAVLGDLLSWTARFFNESGLVTNGRTGDGPWVATAYPRSTAQVFTAPDESGRLTHDYLITDKFAHNFRYYIRPFGRYDLLWRSLLQSPLLFPQTGEDVMPPATPDPTKGGLDVVLDRTQPVAMPLVLKSGRLDAQPKLGPGQKPAPAPPGATWEVIVARHPEQTLAQRNQTVFRQLSYRGLAFTLLRKFAFQVNVDALKKGIGNNHEVPLANIRDIFPEMPTALPAGPAHLNLSTLSPVQARTLDLPLRLGSFQQGAMVLQWEALPFYYEHRLLLVAQTSTTVSPINEITQRDFEYRSPEPVAQVEGLELANDQRARKITVPLKRLWDSLPAEAQLQWPAENPATAKGIPANRRKPGSIPDLDVVYQIVHIFNGNVEVQAELFANPSLLADPAAFVLSATNPPFQFRQLGKSFFVEGALALTAPPAAQASGDYKVILSLLQITKVTLQHSYVINQIQPATQPKLLIESGNQVSIRGVLRPDDVIRILLPECSRSGIVPPGPTTPGLPFPAGSVTDPEAFDNWRVFYREFYATRLVPTLFNLETLAEKLDFPLLTSNDEIPAILADRLTLDSRSATWRGVISRRELAELGRFGNDLPRHRIHRRLIDLVVQQHGQHSQDITVPYLLTTRPLPGSAALPAGLTISVVTVTAADGATQTKWQLNWQGVMSDAVRTVLLGLPGDSSFKQAVSEIVGARPNPETAFPKSSTASFREPVTRVQKSDLTDIFTEDEIASVMIPLDDGTGSNDTDMVFQWRRHAPLPLPASVYKARVQQKFGGSNPQFVLLFDNFINKVGAAVEALGNTFADFPSTPVLLRCRGRLAVEEAQQLRQLSNNDPEVENLIKDVGDRQLLEDISNDWYSTVAISEVPVAVPADIRVDFPEPTQCSLVWKGALDRTFLRSLTGDAAFLEARDEILRARPEVLPASLAGQLTIEAESLRWSGARPTASQEADIRSLSGDAEFLAAVKSLLAEIPDNGPANQVPTVPLSDVIVSAAKVGLDQTPAALKGKITAEQANGNFTAIRWTAQTPMLDSDFLALKQWPAMAAFTGVLDSIARKEVALAAEQGSPTQRPRPQQADLPAALRNKLTIEPEKLTWSGRIHDVSHLVMLEELKGDSAFEAAIAAILQFLRAAPEIALPAVPVRPQTSAQLLVGRALIRYHGLMTPNEGRVLQGDGVFPQQADKDAIVRLFDESMAKGLRGSQLMIRSRRGSAAPSEMVPLTAERLS